jgi:hypothetical protein
MRIPVAMLEMGRLSGMREYALAAVKAHKDGVLMASGSRRVSFLQGRVDLYLLFVEHRTR